MKLSHEQGKWSLIQFPVLRVAESSQSRDFDWGEGVLEYNLAFRDMSDYGSRYCGVRNVLSRTDMSLSLTN